MPGSLRFADQATAARRLEQRTTDQLNLGLEWQIEVVLPGGPTASDRVDLRRLWLALFGATELCAFVVIRTSSFHRMDRFIGVEACGVVAINHVMEIGGILCVAAGAWRFRQPAPAALVGPSE